MTNHVCPTVTYFWAPKRNDGKQSIETRVLASAGTNKHRHTHTNFVPLVEPVSNVITISGNRR